MLVTSLLIAVVEHNDAKLAAVATAEPDVRLCNDVPVTLEPLDILGELDIKDFRLTPLEFSYPFVKAIDLDRKDTSQRVKVVKVIAGKRVPARLDQSPT